MSNFGFFDLALVRPYDVAFHEARSAVKAAHVLERATVHDALRSAIGDCTTVLGTTGADHRDLHLPLYPLEAISSIEHGKVALLFGSEKFGLSNESLSYCQAAIRIPTRDEHSSMNLGQAVAVCLYELRRSEHRAQTRFEEGAPLSAAQSDVLTELWTELLRQSNYIQQRTSESSELKLRRLMLRAGIKDADFESWAGMLRAVLWRLKNG